MIDRPGDGRKTERLVIKCRQETATRFRVLAKDAHIDQETFLNRIVDYWRLTHPGTMRFTPGRTFGDALGFRGRP